MRRSFVEKFFNAKLDADVEFFSEVSTDTRSLKEGALFVAIKGENFDGHDFVDQAFEKGAAAALVSDKKLNKPNCICVESVLEAFSKLSKAWQDEVLSLIHI